ncbi:MAG TPA: NADP-dependent oxidoreductase [Streptosporangiaceae bacterium]|jgi:NADPH:quinone reductase-like Zn-dependent oxidoreductase|nr:NADP-dependent oxidoreductase [Streptosporangiaceae bacterium]
MQVIKVSQFGGPEVLRVGEAGLPQPRPGEVLVRVLAAGVGPWDAFLRRGGWTGPLPYVPGGEFAGLVEGDTGSDAGLNDGAPVYGYPGLTGCYAQYVTCPVEQLAPIPAGLPITDAAAAPIDALTAEQGLTDVLAIGAGDRVLITAGAGGLGHFAVQIARILGASVIATASPEHHEFVHRLGAAVVIDHTRPDWPDQVREVTGGGAERVLACAAPTLDGAARAARDGALIATPVRAELPGAQRVRWEQYDGQPRGTRLIRMAPWFDDGSLSVTVQARYYWHDAAQAHRVAERGHTQGKLVLIVDDDLAATLEV